MRGPSRFSKEQGFSLFELILVIVVFGILSVGMFSFVGISIEGYVDSRDREALQSQARFAVERLGRELRHAVPNSVAIFNPVPGQNAGTCLIYVPIKYAGIYQTLVEGQSKVQASLSTTLDWTKASVTGENVIFNPLKISDFDLSASTNSFKIVSADNTGLLTLSKLATAVWPLGNPSKRLYIYNQSVSFCFEFLNGSSKNGRLIRRVIDGTSTNNTGQVLARNLLSGSQFTLLEASLAQANLINIDYRFGQNEEVSVYNQQIQVTNVP